MSIFCVKDYFEDFYTIQNKKWMNLPQWNLLENS